MVSRASFAADCGPTDQSVRRLGLPTRLKRIIMFDLKRILFRKSQKPFRTRDYWERRYASGKTSGPGSYGEQARFKATIVNDFVREHHVESIIEFGCGDGNQLLLAEYPRYIGLDVSPAALSICMEKFSDDLTKSFFLYDSLSFVDNARLFQADLALSLDVIYHLIEDAVFRTYMKHLFSSAKRFVIIYSCDFEDTSANWEEHNVPRKFSEYVTENFPRWRLTKKIDNIYPYDPSTGKGSWSDFYIYALDQEAGAKIHEKYAYPDNSI